MKKKYSIAVLSGDGIGPEVTEQAVKVLKKVAQLDNFSLSFKDALVGAVAIDKTGDPLPPETENLVKKVDAVLFGAIGDPRFDNNPNAKVRPEQGLLRLRKLLNLYANIRPIKTYECLYEKSPLKKEIVEGVDFIVVRELTGGIYFGQPRGRSEDNNTAFDTAVYNKEEIKRVAEIAFGFAKVREKKVLVVDKANVLATSRLWRETVEEFKKEKFPDIQLDFMFVDNAAMQIIKRPAEFDVILTSNMFGDILTDEASVITGSLGMLPSASIGEYEGRKRGMFEPIHGSYPKAAGKNIANPIGAILSAAEFLRFLGEEESARKIERAVETALKKGRVTKDINPDNYISSTDLTEFIINEL